MDDADAALPGDGDGHAVIEKLPIVDEEGRLKGLITIKDIEKAEVYPNSARPPPLR